MKAHGIFTIKGEDLEDLDAQARRIIEHFLGGMPLPSTFDYFIDAARTGFEPRNAAHDVVYSAYVWDATVTFDASAAILERAYRGKAVGP